MILKYISHENFISIQGRVVFFAGNPAENPQESYTKKVNPPKVDTSNRKKGAAEFAAPLAETPTAESNEETDKKLLKDRNFLNALWRMEWLLYKYFRQDFLKSETAKTLKAKYPEKFASKYFSIISDGVAKKLSLENGRSVYLHNEKEPGNPWRYAFQPSYSEDLEQMFGEEIQKLDVKELEYRWIAKKQMVETMKKDKIDFERGFTFNGGLDLAVATFPEWKHGEWLYATVQSDFLMNLTNEAKSMNFFVFNDFSGGPVSLTFERKIITTSKGKVRQFMFTFQRQGVAVSNYKIMLPANVLYTENLAQILAKIIQIEEDYRESEGRMLQTARRVEGGIDKLKRLK